MCYVLDMYYARGSFGRLLILIAFKIAIKIVLHFANKFCNKETNKKTTKILILFNRFNFYVI